MKFRVVFYRCMEATVWIGYEGSGNPADEHKIIGVAKEYHEPRHFTKSETVGENIMDLPIEERR